MNNNKMLFIQSRGLGDLIIALPIAGYYRDLGHEIHWPICQEFVYSMQEIAPWVNWIGIEADSGGRFFYHRPMEIAGELGITPVINLMQWLNATPSETDPDLWYTCKFDQYKYQKARVPFGQKWKLGDFVSFNLEAEESLTQSVLGGDRNTPYWLIHRHGSDIVMDVDTSGIPTGHRVIEVSNITTSPWHWRGLIQNAFGVIMIDSCLANFADQLGIVPKNAYFIRRWDRDIDLVPVFQSHWNMVPIKNPENIELRRQYLDFYKMGIWEREGLHWNGRQIVHNPTPPAPTNREQSQSFQPFTNTQVKYPTSFL